MPTLRHHAQMIAALLAAGILSPDQVRADSGESLFILQELQAVEQVPYTTPFGKFKAEQLIPIDATVPPGAQEWGYDRITEFGMAQWMSPDGRDIPFSDVDRSRITFPLRTMVNGYRYTRDELEAAAFAQRPLEPHLAAGARRGIDAFRDQVFLTGDATAGFEGFINSSVVPSGNVAHGTWDGTGATVDQIIAEIQQTTYAMGALTRENYYPDTLVVPTVVYAYLTTTARSSTSDKTIWEFVVANNPYLKNLVMLSQLGISGTDENGYFTGSNSGRAIFYKKDPEVVVGKVAILFDQLPPQFVGYGVEVPCRGKIGGVHWRVPIAGRYLVGVR